MLQYGIRIDSKRILSDVTQPGWPGVLEYGIRANGKRILSDATRPRWSGVLQGRSWSSIIARTTLGIHQ
jgi:hypothetical protein